MGLAQEREDLKDRQYDWGQRWLHDMHWLGGSSLPCPCSDCKWKREHERKNVSDNIARLWDIDHPYYCNEGNYFSTDSECSCHYARWQDFIESQGDLDLDMNLVFRWDWDAPRKDGEFENPIEWQGDENYRDCQLKLFYMGQRKGYYRWVTVDVCRADEPAVREWLQVRWNHMRKLWEPLSV